MKRTNHTLGVLALLLAAAGPARAQQAPGDCFTLSAQELFSTATANLTGPQPELERLARVLKRSPAATGITIRGYTDHLGDLDKNNVLSQRRADAVKQFLVDRGVAPERLNAVGMGPADPVASCEGMAGAALDKCLMPNRRVVVDGVTVRRLPQRKAAALDAARTSR